VSETVIYGPGRFLFTIFLALAWIMMLYTLNFFYLAYLSKKNERRKNTEAAPAALPTVTVQLPLYNEKYVVRRLIDAVCRMDYPKEKLQIQVLDDSDDDTADLIRSIVSEYRFKGFDIVHMHRTERVGYKAGALRAGTASAKGEFIAIFDADFIPPARFLRLAIGHFADPKLGLVQCKWGHVNEDYSTMTEAQAVSLDLHFLVEQKAKSLTHIFMNFNGTAGIWRKSCIAESGGWDTATLVEDLDLSYRAQMNGWKCLFLEDVVADAELPVQMNAAKRQQFRWAKGSIQVAMKMMLDVVFSRTIPAETKVQACVQMTRSVVNPLFLAQFLIFPMLLSMQYEMYDVSWAPIALWGLYVAIGPGGYLLVINRVWKDGWRRKARQFLFLSLFTSGMTVNNSIAVFDAIFGRKNEFLRTPKFGVVKKGDDWRNKEYVLPFTRTTLLEIFFAIYGFISICTAIFSGNAIFVPLLVLPTMGFVYVAYLSIAHSNFRKKRMLVPAVVGAPAVEVPAVAKKSVGQRILLPGMIAFLVAGAGVAYYGYYTSVYQVQQAVGYLERAEVAQTPQQLAEYLKMAERVVPEGGNPTWIFPVVRTDFTSIRGELESVLVRAEIVSLQEPHTEEYNTAMRDMHAASLAARDNLREATPFLYITPTNLGLSGAWVAAILAIFAAVRRAGARHRKVVAAQAKM
jgi:cellulose synthase/poly-beta-1,6-N-acetylglucosamine synthase-like glycosyltransferase